MPPIPQQNTPGVPFYKRGLQLRGDGDLGLKSRLVWRRSWLPMLPQYRHLEAAPSGLPEVESVAAYCPWPCPTCFLTTSLLPDKQARRPRACKRARGPGAVMRPKVGQWSLFGVAVVTCLKCGKQVVRTWVLNAGKPGTGRQSTAKPE